jgi:SM-20-related protein
MLDLAPLESAPLMHDPYDHVVAGGLLPTAALATINAHFPKLKGGGIYPVASVRGGPAFDALVEAVRGPELTEILSEKFALDLAARPVMVTVRGFCRSSDGRIHADTDAKVATALLYLNEHWVDAGGRLRLLRDPDDIESAAAEVPPLGGTLVAFRCVPHAYHGHLPYEGPRRYLMINWITSAAVAARETARHRFSAAVKRLNPWS